MIKFNKILIEGYGSIIKPTEFILNQKGLNIIRGIVGSGKTTIPSALCWCLFGKTLKYKSQVMTWEELRPENYKGVKVEVYFNVGKINYRVVRCSNYKGKLKIDGKAVKGGNRIFIFKDGDIITSERNIADQKKYITDVLGYSFDLFKNSIIFGQKMKKIIEESGPDKKKIFEEAFSVMFIKEAKENVEGRLHKSRNLLTDIEYKVDNIVDKVQSKKEQLESAIEYEENFDLDKEERLTKLNEKVSKYEKKLVKPSKPKKKSLDKIKHKRQQAKQKYKDLLKKSSNIDSLKKELKTVEKDIVSKRKTLKSAKPNKCIYCGGVISKEKGKVALEELQAEINNRVGRQYEINNQLKEYDPKELSRVEKDISSLDKKVTSYEKQWDNYEDLLESYQDNKNEFDELKQERSDLENKTIKVKSKKYKKQLKKLKAKLKKTKVKLNNIESDIELDEWLIKDPLSNNGIKAYMFDSMLGRVNDKLYEYSKILGFQVEFGIDLESGRKDFYQAIMKDNIIIPYEDLSGGQKQLVDTSVALAIHDSISEIKPTNLLFMDEPFESLGVNEIGYIEELVERKASDKTVFLITHHPNFNPRYANEIEVTINKRGHTKISNNRA